MFCRLLSAQGQLVISSNINGWDGLEAELAAVPMPVSDVPVFKTLYPKNSPFNSRIGALKTEPGQILQIGINLHSDNRFYRKIQRVLLSGSLILIGLSTLFGWLIAHRAMAGVQRVTQAVSRIQKGQLNQQVPYGNEGREIDKLTEEFNRMLGRIESLVCELKEVSDNVAHDLRSPITRMRGIAETTLTGPQDDEAYREMGLTIIEECDRLAEMINTMLEIAQADSGLIELDRQPLDITALLRTAADLFLPLAEEKKIELRTALCADPLVIYGDKTRLQRTVANLLDNAIKYTPPGEVVTLSVSADENTVHISVADTGCGIAPEEIKRIFDRFYRGEKSRSTQGNGLGLSLAKTIVQAHGGTLTVQSASGKGSAFEITLPRKMETT